MGPTPGPGGEARDFTASTRWCVRTESSRYLLDLAERYIVRFPGSTGSQLRRDLNPIPFVEIACCEVGTPLVLVLDLRGDGCLTIRETTRVLSIHPLAPEEEEPTTGPAEDRLSETGPD